MPRTGKPAKAKNGRYFVGTWISKELKEKIQAKAKRGDRTLAREQERALNAWANMPSE